MNKLADFIAELKRCGVFLIAAVYAGVAFITFQQDWLLHEQRLRRLRHSLPY